MNARTFAHTVAFAAVFVVAAAHAASNPLEPDFYQGKPSHGICPVNHISK